MYVAFNPVIPIMRVYIERILLYYIFNGMRDNIYHV